MNNLIINDTGADIEGISNLCVGDTVIETVNNMGQLYKHQILRNNQNIITHDVHYKESVDQDQNKCYNKIVKDEFFTSSLDNPIREINYQTDSINGNVTRKTLSSLFLYPLYKLECYKIAGAKAAILLHEGLGIEGQISIRIIGWNPGAKNIL